MRKWLSKFVLIKNRKLLVFVFENGPLVAKVSLYPQGFLKIQYFLVYLIAVQIK